MFSFIVPQMLPEEQGFIAFAGSGNRLDGKKKRTNSETEIQSRLDYAKMKYCVQ